MHRSLIRLSFVDHILNNSKFLTAGETFLKLPYYVNLWKNFIFYCNFHGCEWFLILLNKIPFLRSIHLQSKRKVSQLKWISKWEAWSHKFGWVHIFIICTLEWSRTQFVLQWDQWFHDGLKSFFHYLLLLERTFGWALCPSPRSFLFGLHLNWSLNTSVDKKIKCNFYICEFMFNFSLWFKFSIFFSLVLFSLLQEGAGDSTNF